MYSKLQWLLNHVDKAFTCNTTGQVRSYGARLTGGKEGQVYVVGP